MFVIVHKIEYEVVPIFHWDENQHSKSKFGQSKPTVHLKAFNQNYTLYLEVNSHVLLGNNTPIFIANQNRYSRQLDGTPKIVYSRINYVSTRTTFSIEFD